MAINVFKKGRMYSKTVLFKEQALSKAALAAGLDLGLSVRAMHRLASQGMVVQGSHRPVRLQPGTLRSPALCCSESVVFLGAGCSKVCV